MPEEIHEIPRVYENVLTSPELSNINVDEFHGNDYSYNTNINDELLSRDLETSLMFPNNEDEIGESASIWRND